MNLIAGRGFYRPGSGGTYPGDPSGGVFEPNVTATSGTISSVAVVECQYSKSFKVVCATYQLRITTSGAGTGTFNIEPPVDCDGSGPIFAQCNLAQPTGSIDDDTVFVRLDSPGASAAVNLLVSLVYKSQT
jgi:hypothetical protein